MGQVRRAGRVRREVRQRRLLPLLALLLLLPLAPSLRAFDSAGWLGKRELLAREGERLRVAYSNCVSRLETPAEDVSVPVETYPDGSVKVIVFARKAQYFLEEGLVWAEGVTVRRFRNDGTVDGLIEAKSCVVDRFSKCGWAEGPATVVHGKATFKGEGVFFSSPESYVRVCSKVDVVAKDLKFGGLRP